jgi:hypothetical protein
MSAGRKALIVATYEHADAGLRRLTAPERDAESLAAVLEDPQIADFDVTMLVNQPHHVVGEAIADFYADARRDDLTLLYFTGHGVKDDEGRLYLAMTNTRRAALMFTAISAAQLNDAMDASPSRRKVLVLDCCYSGAFPAGRTAKADEGVQTLERFQGKGRAVLTASDATQYAFEGDDLTGSGTSSVFTRHLVEAIRSGEADLDEDGDIALDELYSYVRERVVAEVPGQRPKKQEDVDGRILIARNAHWTLPDHLRHAIESPIAAQRLAAVEGLAHLHRVGNAVVRATVARHLVELAEDDSRSVSTAAAALLDRIRADAPPVSPPPSPAPFPPPPPPPRKPAEQVARASSRALQPEQRSFPPRPTPEIEHPAPVEPAAATPDTGQRAGALVLLPFLVVAFAVLLGSRSVVFESVNDYRAVDLGWSTFEFLVGMALPLLLAIALVLVRRRRSMTVAGATGLAAGVTLTLTGQLVSSAGLFLDPDVGYRTGPGWWLLLVGALVLATGVAAIVSRPSFRARPFLRQDRVAMIAAVVVAASVACWVFVVHSIPLDVGWWLYVKAPGLVLTAACLPLAVLRLDRRMRCVSLVAVTTCGLWLLALLEEAVREPVVELRPGAALAGLAAVVASVAAVYVAQLVRREDRRREAAGSGR